ncbi:MAG: hypothetical protein LBT52_04735 [Clostridiales Family XIII bacterium]|jgi:hypothetical protein|nr:hypothetical protein [Clostridiales Family XIII bacterium]
MSCAETTYLSIPEEEVFPLAERFFLRAAGFDLETEKHQRMYKEAMDVRAKGLDGIRIEGFIATYGSDAYDGASVSVGDQKIHAAAFEQIPAEAVRKVIIYVITAGECLTGEADDIMVQLYAHMWGTAYVDAGRVILENRVKEQTLAESDRMNSAKTGNGERDADESGPLLSPAFSPGFYGMDNKDNITIVDLLGAGEIGVRCVDSGVMLPVKTCTGVFLVTDGSVRFPGDECLVCIGNKTSCAECMIGNRRSLNV